MGYLVYIRSDTEKSTVPEKLTLTSVTALRQHNRYKHGSRITTHLTAKCNYWWMPMEWKYTDAHYKQGTVL